MKQIVDPKEKSPKDFYKILIGSILPRPIALVSTISKSGELNVAPFSFFTVASARPPILCFSPSFKLAEDGISPVPKDTLVNIRETGDFVVNIVGEETLHEMNQTSFDYSPDVNEFEAAGLTIEQSLKVKSPCVAESLVNYECKLYDILELGSEPMGGSLILGEVVQVHLSDTVYKNGKVDPDILKPIGRLGGLWYSTINDKFELPRPKS